MHMADLASYHYSWHRLAPTWCTDVSITYMIVDIISYVYMQKSTSNSRYWWSCGSAKFDAATASVQAKLRRAITLSILHQFRQFLQIDEDNVVYIHRASRDDDMRSEYNIHYCISLPRCLHDGTVMVGGGCVAYRTLYLPPRDGFGRYGAVI